VRYDESTASRLPEMAALANDITPATRLLKEFKGIGEIGAGIFRREVQDVWTFVRPYFDKKAFDKKAGASARELGLPGDPDKLAGLAPRGDAKLAAALVRVSVEDDVRAKVTG